MRSAVGMNVGWLGWKQSIHQIIIIIYETCLFVLCLFMVCIRLTYVEFELHYVGILYADDGSSHFVSLPRNRGGPSSFTRACVVVFVND